MIAIIDYGAGNLRSVSRAIEVAGGNPLVTSHPEDILSASGVILPGVGAFGRAMEKLLQLGLTTSLIDRAKQRRPLLGICLGMQLLFETSDECFPQDGARPRGLCLLRGKVRHFSGKVKVPQIGWNQVMPVRKSVLFEGIPSGSHVYFVHSYYVVPDEPGVMAATSDYGIPFASAVEQGMLFGIQFHPEKSAAVGLQVLRNYLRFCREG